MYRLSQTAVAFAELDGLPDDQFPTLDKSLRNLTQRHPISPVEQAGRAGLFSFTKIAVLRLAHKASAFGLDRLQVDTLIRFLDAAPTSAARFHQREGYRVAMTVIEEAIERAHSGEDFSVGLAMGGDGRAQPKVWWKTNISTEAQTILDNAQAANPHPPADACFTLDAGRLIRELATKLGA